MKRKNNLKTSSSGATYASAGVSIDAGNALVERIKPFCKATKRPGVMSGLGGFGALFDLKAAGFKDPILVSGTDGVGTKIKIALDTGDFSTIGQDLVAMCVNDLVVQGATPLFFLDYYACGALDVAAAASVIKGIADGCRRANCALIGGETAEMPGLYQHGDIDLAGFCVGAVERNRLLPDTKKMKAGDVVLGLASSGFHSNGYSLVRKLAADHGIDYAAAPPASAKTKAATIGGWLLTPTRIYVASCLHALESVPGIRGFSHITGGGITENVPRVLPEHLAAEIDLATWTLPTAFQWARTLGGIAEAEMLRAFNCGIGMAVIVARRDAEKAIAAFKERKEKVFRIGRLIERSTQGVEYRGRLA